MKPPITPSSGKTGSELLQELGMKLSTQEIKDRVNARRLDENMQIVKSTMCCLHEIYDEVFAAPTSTTEGVSK